MLETQKKIHNRYSFFFLRSTTKIVKLTNFYQLSFWLTINIIFFYIPLIIPSGCQKFQIKIVKSNFIPLSCCSCRGLDVVLLGAFTPSHFIMHSTSKLLIFFTTSFKYYFFISFYYFFVFIFFILSPSWSHCLSLPLFLNPAILLTASHQPPQFQRSETHAELLANDPRQSPLNANAHAGQRPTNPRSHKIKSPR